jgi:excisionase family DNA binding protein
MKSNLNGVKARARLLLASDKWHELFQFLERDVPALIAEVEQLRRELADAKRHEGRPRPPAPEVSQPPARGPSESQLLTSKQFAYAIGVTEACVRRWTLLRKIKVVKLGRLVRIPRVEVQRLIDEGAIPMRPSRKLAPQPRTI